MWAMKVVIVQVALGPIDHVVHRRRSPLRWRTATVSDRGGGVRLVVGTKMGDDVLPCRSRRGKAVQEHNRRPVRSHAKILTQPRLEAEGFTATSTPRRPSGETD